jgi:hypothetical protein
MRRFERTEGGNRTRLGFFATAVAVAALAAPALASARSYSLPPPISAVVAPTSDSGAITGTVSWSDVSWSDVSVGG